MARVCQLTGKRTVSGNNVSHAHNKSRRKFKPNLHTKRLWDDERQVWVKLRLSHKALRTIDKRGRARFLLTWELPRMARQDSLARGCGSHRSSHLGCVSGFGKIS